MTSKAVALKAASSSSSSSSSTSSKPSSAYKNVLGGKLALKPPRPNKTEKNKKTLRMVAANRRAQTKEPEETPPPTDSIASTSDIPASSLADAGLTKAEKNFLDAQREREKDLVQSKITKTHRQRIEEFNKMLAGMSEHNDIPRVGPG